MIRNEASGGALRAGRSPSHGRGKALPAPCATASAMEGGAEKAQNHPKAIEMSHDSLMGHEEMAFQVLSGHEKAPIASRFGKFLGFRLRRWMKRHSSSCRRRPRRR